MSTVLIIAVLLQLITKIILIGSEGALNIPLLLIDVIITLALFALYHFSKLPKSTSRRPGITPALIALFIFGLSLGITVNKSAQDWDSLSLYDARAKYFSEGTKFSEMGDLTLYDIPENRPYYLLYPPFTSVMHYLWQNVFGPIPVSVMYSLFFGLTLAGLISLLKDELSPVALGFLILIVGLDKEIFTLSTLEYSNIPFMMYTLLGTLCAVKAIESKSWKLTLLSALLFSGAVWTRQVEPIWVFISLSIFAHGLLMKNKHTIVTSLMIFATSLITYLGWSSFVKYSGTPSLVLYSPGNFNDLFQGFWNGNFMEVFKFFISVWGLYLIPYLSVILLGVLKFKKLLNHPKLFIIWSILITVMLFYLGGMYYMSFQKPTWMVLGNSMVRSSVFIFPLTAIFIVKSKALLE